MPSYADFPAEEFEERYARARKLMDKEGLDALLITDVSNYIYFTGHRSQQNILDKIRPYVVILPKKGDVVLITAAMEAQQVRETTWIKDMRPIEGLMGHPATIASILKEIGLAKGRIGAELGREQRLGISYNEFGEICKALPNASFVDAARVLLTLRATKSPREVEYIREAGRITLAAVAEAFEAAHSGMTELEVSRILRTSVARNGGEGVPFMWVVSHVDVASGGLGNAIATDRKLQPGDVLTLDFGVEYRGYKSDISRCAIVGEPPDEVADFYRWLKSVGKRCRATMRAGNRPSDVVTALKAALLERGLATGKTGRFGHGVGLDCTEYPSLFEGEDVVFEPGMVMTCNPTFVREFGWMNDEDQWLFTRGALEMLSQPESPAEIPVLRVK